MKNLRKSNLFTTCLVMLVSFSVIGFVGCEKEAFISEKENIQNSSEFKAYVQARILLSNSFVDLERKTGKNFKRLKKTNKGEVKLKSVKSNSFNPELFLNVMKYEKVLKEKYPEFEKFSEEEKKKMMQNAIEKNTKIAELLEDRRISMALPRLKGGEVENPDTTGVYSYDTYEDAFNAQRYYSYTVDSVECAAHLYSNGTACVFINGTNTDSTCTFPIFRRSDGSVSVWYNGDTIVGISHSHFDSGTPSNADMDAMFEFLGSVDLYIILGDSVYYYDF